MLIPKVDERRRTSAWPCSLCQAPGRQKARIRGGGSLTASAQAIDRLDRRAPICTLRPADENEAEIEQQNQGRGDRNDGGRSRGRDARGARPRDGLTPSPP